MNKKFRLTQEKERTLTDDILQVEETPEVQEIREELTASEPKEEVIETQEDKFSPEGGKVEHPKLEDIEKLYLNTIMANYKHDVIWIMKVSTDDTSYERLKIKVRTPYDRLKQYDIVMEMFKKGTKFAGLDNGKMYFIEELGL